MNRSSGSIQPTGGVYAFHLCDIIAAMNKLAQYIKSQEGGAIYRRNPVIQRIANETGYSVETIYRAAVGNGVIRSRAVEVALSKYTVRNRRRSN